MESELEVLDAFVDGDVVDAAVLKAVLATAEGRDYFVDAWLLREAVRRETVESAPAVTARPAVWRHVPHWLVAAGLAGAVLGGYALGSLTAPQPPQVVAPLATPKVVTAPTAFPVPAPTRVIQLEFISPATTSGGD